MRSIRLAGVAVFVALHALAVPLRAQSPGSLLDTAIMRMGGMAVVSNVKRAHFEMITQWRRVTFDERPYGDQPVYELHSDLRDYDAGAWRNTRRFFGAGPNREIVDVVRDSVAIRRSAGGSGGVASPAVVSAGTWTTLNIAYVDERRELFALAPERLLIGALRARDLRFAGDTVIAGAPHARLEATVDRFPMSILLNRRTGFLTAARFRVAEPNDFGLAPYGEMTVELWYSAWRKQGDGLVYPFQWDVSRLGRPYKRMTVLAAVFNPPASPDSFAVSDSLRTAYVAMATRPMHEIELDSARLIDGRFASFATPGAPVGAVKLGREWLLLETGQAPSTIDRAAAWIAMHDHEGSLAGALITTPGSGAGGAPAIVRRGLPLHVGPGATPFVAASLRGYRTSTAALSVVRQGAWVRVSGDSLWVETIDLPDAPGALVAYVPSLEWVYSSAAANPVNLDLVLMRAHARGWRVSRIGSSSSVVAEIASASP